MTDLELELYSSVILQLGFSPLTVGVDLVLDLILVAVFKTGD